MSAAKAIEKIAQGDERFADFGAFFQNWGYSAFDAASFADRFAHHSFGIIKAGTEDITGGLLYRLAGDEAEIIEIAVAEPYRQQGIARDMLAALQEALRSQNIRRLILEVAEDNHAACQLYAACGFVQAGRRAGYYRAQSGGDRAQKIDAIIMELWLSKA